jgi:beta-glucosidase
VAPDQPIGSGAVQRRGLDFYRELCGGLRDREIAAFIILYHW